MTEESNVIEKQKTVTSAAIATLKEELEKYQSLIDDRKSELKKLEKAFKGTGIMGIE